MNRSKLICLPAIAIALAGCGGDDPPAPAEETGASGTGTAAEAAPERSGADGGAGSVAPGETAAGPGPEGSGGDAPAEESSPAPDGPSKGEDAGGACEYHPPPGRLGTSTVSIELSGTPCEAGRRLAKAAALGQPAGANIPVSAEGYRCEPSTRERGVNVVYSCSKGSRSASFEIEWTAG